MATEAHSWAINQYLDAGYVKTGPRIAGRKRGFIADVARALRYVSKEDREEAKEFKQRFVQERFVPDCYKIVVAERAIIAVEVDVYGEMSPNKKAFYASLGLSLHLFGFTLCVIKTCMHPRSLKMTSANYAWWLDL